MDKRLFSVEEAANYLGISPRTIYNGTGRKTQVPFHIPCKRWGKKILFDIKDLENFVSALGSSSREQNVTTRNLKDN